MPIGSTPLTTPQPNWVSCSPRTARWRSRPNRRRHLREKRAHAVTVVVSWVDEPQVQDIARLMVRVAVGHEPVIVLVGADLRCLTVLIGIERYLHTTNADVGVVTLDSVSSGAPAPPVQRHRVLRNWIAVALDREAHEVVRGAHAVGRSSRGRALSGHRAD